MGHALTTESNNLSTADASEKACLVTLGFGDKWHGLLTYAATILRVSRCGFICFTAYFLSLKAFLRSISQSYTHAKKTQPNYISSTGPRTSVPFKPLALCHTSILRSCRKRGSLVPNLPPASHAMHENVDSYSRSISHVHVYVNTVATKIFFNSNQDYKHLDLEQAQPRKAFLPSQENLTEKRFDDKPQSMIGNKSCVLFNSRLISLSEGKYSFFQHN